MIKFKRSNTRTSSRLLLRRVQDSKQSRIIILPAVFILCAIVGYTAGQIIRHNNKPAEAIGANIVVTDNEQIVTVEQSTSATVITKTSTLTVTDSTANYGYTLSAKLASTTTLAGPIVTIGSSSSTLCTLTSPCALTSAPADILSTDNNNATVVGETTTWEVKIVIPAEADLGEFILDIEYDQSANSSSGSLIPPPGIPGSLNFWDATVLDVYPTTGWEGDVVAITSNSNNIDFGFGIEGDPFTNVESVTIGGTSCDPYEVISTAVILCRLPAKPSGSTNEIVIINDGVNLSDASVYTHMKVTYFDPSQTTVTFADTATFGSSTFSYYPDGFTSTDCAGLTPNNTNNVDIPASLVFVRDTRNNQVYKVKKMVDNKCWMIDNLKYAGPTDSNDNPIQNYDGVDAGGVFNGTAGSIGLSYRNRGVFIIDGDSFILIGPINTVDGTNTQSAINSNQAFYNNPMGEPGCYEGSSDNMAANTLTYCGYHYNWYAATGGTGTYDTNGMDTNGNQSSGSICPANFRLPSMSSGTGGPTTSGVVSTHADFPVLNTSMDAGSIFEGGEWGPNADFSGWMPTGQWSGIFSGARFNSYGSANGSLNPGNDTSSFWSSTAASADSASQLFIIQGFAYIGSFSSQALKSWGLSVRCLIE